MQSSGLIVAALFIVCCGVVAGNPVARQEDATDPKTQRGSRIFHPAAKDWSFHYAWALPPLPSFSSVSGLFVEDKDEMVVLQKRISVLEKSQAEILEYLKGMNAVIKLPCEEKPVEGLEQPASKPEVINAAPVEKEVEKAPVQSTVAPVEEEKVSETLVDEAQAEKEVTATSAPDVQTDKKVQEVVSKSEADKGAQTEVKKPDADKPSESELKKPETGTESESVDSQPLADQKPQTRVSKPVNRNPQTKLTKSEEQPETNPEANQRPEAAATEPEADQKPIRTEANGNEETSTGAAVPEKLADRLAEPVDTQTSTKGGNEDYLEDSLARLGSWLPELPKQHRGGSRGAERIASKIKPGKLRPEELELASLIAFT